MKDIHLEAIHIRLDDSTQRPGQVYFNAAHALDPEWADRYRRSTLDPFYNDEVLPWFLRHWHEDHA